MTDETPAAPRLSYGAQKLVCEILIDDYTRRGYIDGRALRLPAVLVRPGGPNTAVSGWSSAIIREPLAGRDYVCPVAPGTRLACISIGKVVQSFLHALALPSEKIGARRTLLLNGISVERAGDVGRGEAQGEGQGALRARSCAAGGHGRRAQVDRFGKEAPPSAFRRSKDIQEIVREYEEAAVAHHG